MMSKIVVSLILTLLSLAVVSGAQRIIGFPLSGVLTNVSTFDLTSTAVQNLVYGVPFATPYKPMRGAVDPATSSVFFHGVKLPQGHYDAVVRVNINTKVTSSVVIGDTSIQDALPLFYGPSKTLFEWITYIPDRERPDRSIVCLYKVDFEAGNLILIKNFTEFARSLLTSFDGQSGILYGEIVDQKGQFSNVAVNVLNGEYKSLPKMQPMMSSFYDLVAFGWNSLEKVVDILVVDDHLEINNQRNYTVFKWDPITGRLDSSAPKFLFPPKSTLQGGRVDFVSSTYDSTSGTLYAAYSDRSSANIVVSVSSKTGQPISIAKFNVWNEPRQMVVAPQ